MQTIKGDARRNPNASLPGRSTTLGVFVSYEAHKESGEDLCDYNIKESRYVALDKLMSYLAERGIRRMSNGRVVRIRMRY